MLKLSWIRLIADMGIRRQWMDRNHPKDNYVQVVAPTLRAAVMRRETGLGDFRDAPPAPSPYQLSSQVLALLLTKVNNIFVDA